MIRLFTLLLLASFPVVQGFAQTTENASTQLCAYSVSLQALLAQEKNSPISNEEKASLLESVQNLCLPDLHSAGAAPIRASKLIAGVATSAVTANFRWIEQFIRGMITVRKHPRGKSYSEIMGVKTGSSVDWITAAMDVAYTLIASGNPLTLTWDLISTLDSHSQAFCKSTLTKTESALRFCANYEAIKDGEYAYVETGEALGIRVGRTFLRVFDFRKDGVVDPAFCKLGVRKQARIARRALKRLEMILDNDRIQLFLVPPSSAKNRCASIRGESKVALTEIQKQGYVDGVSYSLVEGHQDETDPGAQLDVCEEIEKTKFFATDFQQQRFRNRLMGLEIGLNPARFTEPVFKEYPNAQLQKADPASVLVASRNVILLTEAMPDHLNEMKELKAKLEEQRKLLKQIYAISTYQECKARLVQTPFDLNAFFDLNRQYKRAKLQGDPKNLKLEKREVHRAGRELVGIINHLKRHWEIQPFHDLNQLRHALRDPTIRHLIVVGHASQLGTLVDNELNALDSPKAFDQISPHLQSLGLFMCHGRAWYQHYSLDQLFSGVASLYPVRMFGMAEPKDFLKDSELDELPGLSTFLTAYDQKVAELERKTDEAIQEFSSHQALWTQVPVLKPKEKCVARLDGAAFTRGAFEFEINGEWMGMVYPANQNASAIFEFDCEELKANSWLQLREASGAIASDLFQSEVTLTIYPKANPNQVIATARPDLKKGVFYSLERRVTRMEWDL